MMKRPEKIRDARRVALLSYSMWANYLGIATLIASDVIYAVWKVDTNPRVWWIMGLALIVLGIIGRLVHQRGFTRSPAFVMVAAVLLAMGQWQTAAAPESPPSDDLSANYSTQDFLTVAVPLIAKWEGLRTEAYQDIVGVWTVCYGETKGVRPGDSYSEAECRDMLAREVRSYRQGWRGHITAETALQRLHAPREAAFVSLAYNVGIAGAGKSTATRRLNGGNVAGACTAIGWWNRAGDRVVRGLVNRRAEEVAMCRRGLG